MPCRRGSCRRAAGWLARLRAYDRRRGTGGETRLRRRLLRAGAVLDHAAGDLAHLDPLLHGSGANPAECLVLLHAQLIHEHTFGPADPALVLDHVLEVADLLLEGAQLLEAADGDLDGGDDLARLERLHQVG